MDNINSFKAILHLNKAVISLQICVQDLSAVMQFFYKALPHFFNHFFSI